MNRRGFLGTVAVSAFAAPPATEKRLMVHADDIGMCHSVNLAAMDALANGSVSSASIMMPCPWVLEIAEWARAHPDADLGLHLTLTSEWKHYRWRPVAPPDQVKGLIDPEGCMWRDVASVARNATAREVEIELRAQIARAKQYGIRFTHFDTHMGTLYAQPAFFDLYADLAREHNVPCMIPRVTPEMMAKVKEYPVTAEQLKRREAVGMAVLDDLVTGVPGRNFEERRQSYRELIGRLKPGVTKLIIHPAKDDPEIRAITGLWETRWSDYRFWTSAEAKELLGRNGVRLITYREFGGR